MVFSSTVFLFLFLPLVLGLYYFPGLRHHRKYKNTLLLIASIFFYSWGEPLFVFLMLFSILLTWLIGLGEGSGNPKTAKLFLTLGTAYHIGILVVFKYLSFFSQELNRILGLSASGIDIALPIGISFFTFQMMSYLFDVWYGRAKVQRNILNLALYVSLFPQLIAGPIVRYETVEDEIMNRRESWGDFSSGLRRFLLGLGKKVLIADYLAVIADNVYSLAHVGHIPVLTAWLGAVSYMLQIYFDFSGYSDMAIGLGLCFGFHFRENFRYPYLANSVNNYWRNWHISLSDWFRDYVYIPLGGNRVSHRRHLLNIMIVWTLTGLWHGANWTYLIWGLLYGIILILEKYVYHPEKWPKWLGNLYMLMTVCLCFVIFRSACLSDAGRYLRDMFNFRILYDSVSLYYLRSSIVILLLAIACCHPLGLFFGRLFSRGNAALLGESFLILLLIFILAMAAVLSISGGYSPFIYFNF